MLTALFIGLWAYLFCMPLSEPGEFFGWTRRALFNIFYLIIKRNPADERLEQILDKVFFCPKCHAGQVALWWQVWAVTHGGQFDIPFILIAIFVAYALQRIDELIEALKHK